MDNLPPERRGLFANNKRADHGERRTHRRGKNPRTGRFVRSIQQRQGDSLITGFSPRKQALTVYIMPGFSEYGDLLTKLGKCKTSRSCLYINKLEDVDLKVLEKLIRKSVAYMRKKYKV